MTFQRPITCLSAAFIFLFAVPVLLADASESPTPAPAESKLYKQPPGPYEVQSVATFTLHDKQRDKNLPLRITWPKAAGPFPLIIFSHGALGSKDAYTPLVEYWAQHGYIVIQPTHGDSASLMSAEQKKQVESASQLVNSMQVKREWRNRPLDIKLVIDSLDAIAKQVEGLTGKMDGKRIAVAGHSYGAYTTMLVAGMKMYMPGGRRSIQLTDDRPACFVAISPQGTTRSIRTESYQPFNRPMLMITGDNDSTPIEGRTHEKGEWRKQAYDGTPPGDKYLLWINGAHHGFGGISGPKRWPGSGPDDNTQVQIIRTTALAFFDAYLKKDTDAKTYLDTDAVKTKTNNTAHIDKK